MAVNLIADCVYDYCSVKNDSMICEKLEAFAEKCNEMLGFIIEFRSPTMCGAFIEKLSIVIIVCSFI